MSLKALLEERSYRLKEVRRVLGYSLVYTRKLMKKAGLLKKCEFTGVWYINKEEFEEWYDKTVEKLRKE